MINLEITFKCWKISEYLAHFKIFHRIFGFKMYVFKLGALNFQMIVNIFVKLWAEVCIERHYFLMRFIFLYIRKNKVMYSGISSTSSSWNIHGRFWIFFFFFFCSSVDKFWKVWVMTTLQLCLTETCYLYTL